MSLVSSQFRIILALVVLSLTLLLSCSTSTDSGEKPAPLNNWPTKPVLDTENGAPPLNANNVSIDTELKWKSTDADGDSLLFDIYFGTGKQPPKIATDITEMTYTPGPLAYSTKYYWKVAAKDGHDHIATSPVWNFTTSDAPQNPSIKISTSIVNFGKNSLEARFTIENIGTGTLDWSITKPAGTNWLLYSPTVGTTLGEIDTITVTVNRDSLADGLYAADLVIQSNHGLAEDIVRVEMEVIHGDYYGEMSVIYNHSDITMEWRFIDTIKADFVLSVDSGKVTGTFDAVHLVTIETIPECTYDSLVNPPFNGTISGTDLIDNMVFDFSPIAMPLSFKLKCDSVGVQVPPYQIPIGIHLRALNVSIEKTDGSIDFGFGSLPVFSWPVMSYSYKVTIHKL